jgi:hypothetical protein
MTGPELAKLGEKVGLTLDPDEPKRSLSRLLLLSL